MWTAVINKHHRTVWSNRPRTSLLFILNVNYVVSLRLHKLLCGLKLLPIKVVIVGNITTKLPLDRVERITSNEFKAASKPLENRPRAVYDTAMQERKARFKMELDVRGERVNDALEQVMRYIDDAIMLNVSSVRILHGKGTGALREEIQKYVRTVPGVQSAADEHVQFGGAGITVVDL